MAELAFTLDELARLVGADVSGDGARIVKGLGSLDGAGPDDISHLSSPAYRHLLAGTRAGALILSNEDLKLWEGDALVVANPYLAFAKISQKFARLPELSPGVDEQASIAEGADIASTAAIGPGVSVGPRTRIGESARLYAGVAIGEDCEIGDGVMIMPNAVVYHGVSIGARSVVHSNAVIGADGFGFTPDESGRLQPIAQIGGVVIGEDVSIGASTTIDRGTIDDTVIEEGVKIDNQVQIGHNVRIGSHSIICGCVGIVGSSTIGRHVVLAGGAGVGGDGPIEICDQVVITATTLVTSSISEPGIYSGGVLHSPTRQWKRNALRFARLDELFKRVAVLEKAIGRRKSD